MVKEQVINQEPYKKKSKEFKCLGKLTPEERRANGLNSTPSESPSSKPSDPPSSNGDTIDSLRATIVDLETSSAATIKSLELLIVQKDSIIADLSLQIENIGVPNDPTSSPSSNPSNFHSSTPSTNPTAEPTSQDPVVNCRDNCARAYITAGEDYSGYGLSPRPQ